MVLERECKGLTSNRKGEGRILEMPLPQRKSLYGAHAEN